MLLWGECSGEVGSCNTSGEVCQTKRSAAMCTAGGNKDSQAPEQAEVLLRGEGGGGLGRQQGGGGADPGVDQAVGHGGNAAGQHIAAQDLGPGASRVEHCPAVLNWTGGTLHSQRYVLYAWLKHLNCLSL